MSRRIEGVFSAIGEWLEKEVAAERKSAMRKAFGTVESVLLSRIDDARRQHRDADEALLRDVMAHINNVAAVVGAEE